MLTVSDLFELKKAEKMIAAGKISGKGVEDLKKKGMIRSERQYMKGIDKGTAFKLKGTGSKIYRTGEADATGPISFMPSKGVFGSSPGQIQMPKGSARAARKTQAELGASYTPTGLYKREMPLYRRHEADEIKMGLGREKREANLAPIQFKKKGKHLATHMSPEVLSKEKKLVDYTSRAYGTGRGLRRMRQKTGEYDFIKGMSKRQMRKMEDRAAKHTDEQTVKASDLRPKLRKGMTDKERYKALEDYEREHDRIQKNIPYVAKLS